MLQSSSGFSSRLFLHALQNTLGNETDLDSGCGALFQTSAFRAGGLLTQLDAFENL